METKMKLLIGILGLWLAFGSCGSAFGQQIDPINQENYPINLTDLAKNTWNSINYCVNETTGIAYDNSAKGYTGIDKIGFYIASVAVARELGFISPEDASERVNKTVNTLLDLSELNDSNLTWSGPNGDQNIRIPYTWYNINDSKTPQFEQEKYEICSIDLGNYYACLIIGKNAFPEEKDNFEKLMTYINWSVFYEDDTFHHTYRVNKTNPSEGKWEHDLTYLASDSQTASFLGIANKSVPVEHWIRLDRTYEERYRYRYYNPGWRDGLFMQFLPGIFIDQRQTLMGASAKNLTKAQINHSTNLSPVWGWSPSSSVPLDLSDTESLTFYYNSSGNANTLQLKLEDITKTIFHKRIPINVSKEQKVVINYSDMGTI